MCSMREIETTAAQGEGWRRVREVLDEWVQPRLAREDLPEADRQAPLPTTRLRPVAGQPGQLGEFVMIATAYGNRDGWWITPESPRALTRRSTRSDQ